MTRLSGIIKEIYVMLKIIDNRNTLSGLSHLSFYEMSNNRRRFLFDTDVSDADVQMAIDDAKGIIGDDNAYEVEIRTVSTEESVLDCDEYSVTKYGDDDYSVFFKNNDCSLRGRLRDITSKIFSVYHPKISEKLGTEEYSFLNENEHLGDNIILLGLGGSHAYGTNLPGSDVDIRGVALNSKSDLLGMSHFENFVNTDTDTTVYGINKFFNLLMECNPNIIEMLGLEPEDYALLTPVGKKILDNRDLFLSQRAYYSFGGFAYAQLKRLQNATARDSLPDAERELHILNSIQKQLDNIEKEFSAEGGGILLYVDDAVTEGHTKEIFMDGHFKRYPLRQFNMRFNAMNQVCKDYDHVDHRNRKKDDKHLNKHAMHLIRLYQMAIEILSGDGIHTKRKGDDLSLLMDIRNGKYMTDSIMCPEFYELVDEYQARLEEVFSKTNLPKKPNVKAIEKLLIEINENAIR